MQHILTGLWVGLFLLPSLLPAQPSLVLVGYDGPGPIANYQTTISLLSLHADGHFTYSVFDHWWGPSIHSIGEGEVQEQAVVSTGTWSDELGVFRLAWDDPQHCLRTYHNLEVRGHHFILRSSQAAIPPCEVPNFQDLSSFLVDHPWLQPWLEKMAQLPQPTHRLGNT
ncbi:MAG: hypothetical protein AAF399_07770 [Bacteroidota bacterium]